MNRRAFLKAASAAPLAAAMPAVAMTIPVDVSAAPVEAVAVVEKYPWRWWVGNDDALWESFDTRERAVEFAKAEGWDYVTEARHEDYDLRVDGDQLLESLFYRNEDRVNEDGDFIDATPEQVRDLERRVDAAIRDWVEANKIETRAWMMDCRDFLSIPREPSK